MMKKIHLTLLFSSLLVLVLAQNTKTVLHVTDNAYNPIPQVTILLQSKKDSTQRYNRISDSIGNAGFQVSPGTYKAFISAIGFKSLEKTIAVSSSQNRFNFVLETDVKAMAGVVITAKKSLMRQEDDKTIVDPENLANSSTNAYEVVEKIVKRL